MPAQVYQPPRWVLRLGLTSLNDLATGLLAAGYIAAATLLLDGALACAADAFRAGRTHGAPN
jgi:hypothetical protein